MTPQPDFAATLQFLKNWLPDGPWCLTVIPFDRSQGTITATFYPKDGSTDLTDWLGLHNVSAKASVYFVPNPVRGSITSKARREDIVALACLHVDLDPRAGEDFEMEQARILALVQSESPRKLPNPSVIIFSGGGYQLLWKLAEPVMIRDLDHAEELKRYNIQIENVLGGDHCHDVCRLLRLPGTVNWLNAKKVKAGRKPTLATVLESWDERLYDLDAFILAPEVQDVSSPRSASSPRATDVQLSGNIRRLNSVDELGEDVPGLCKIVIVQGDDPDNPARFGGDRSKAVWYVACELARRGIDDDTIFSVLTDPGFAISAHVLEQPNSHKYTLVQIGKAKEAAIDPDLREFNERFMVIQNFGGKCVVAEEVPDELLDRSRLSAMTFDSFRNAFSNRQKEIGNDESIPIAVWWTLHRERRQYERIVFSPEREMPGCYNLWRGFAVEPIPGDGCDLFLRHVKDVLCGGVAAHYDYLVKWMANCVQHPGKPGQVAVVLKGRQGSGKSFFVKMFGHLFGRHFLAITDSRRLVGNFNSHLQDVVLLFADEAFYAGDKKHESNLKGLITEAGIAIEGKGRDIEYQRNCLHLIMASNEDWAVPASLDDRRFFILNVTDGNRNKRRVFDQIEAGLKAGGFGALLHLLLNMDLSEFSVGARPETEALKQEKLNSMSPIHAWWYERLYDAEIQFAGSSGHAQGSWPQEFPKAQMIAEIRRALGAREAAYSDHGIRSKFLKMAPVTLTRPEGRVHWTDHRNENRQTGARPYCWNILDVVACREHWDKEFGQLAPWPPFEQDPVGVYENPSPF